MSDLEAPVSSVETVPPPPAESLSPDDAPEKSLFEQIQAAASKPAPAAVSASQPAATEVPKEAPAAPGEKTPAQAAEPTAAPKEGETTPPEPTPEQAAESIRQVIKSSNLPPAVKQEIADAVYAGKAYKEVGFPIDSLRTLKEQGVTPEILGKRLELHPTLEAEQADAGLAGEHRLLINDLKSDPDVFLDRLWQASPEVTTRLIKAAAEKRGYVAPEDVTRQNATNFRSTLLKLHAEGKESQNLNLQEAARILYERAFGSEIGTPPVSAINPKDPIHRRFNELQAQVAKDREAQQAREQSERQGFVSQVGHEGDRAMYAEITQRVEAATKGWDPDLKQSAINEVFSQVRQGLYANENVMRDLASISYNDQIGRETFNRAINHVLANSRAYIVNPLNKALAKWGKFAAASQTNREATLNKTLDKPDVGRVGGSATPATPGPTPAAQALAEGKEKGWDMLQVIQRKQELIAQKGR